LPLGKKKVNNIKRKKMSKVSYKELMDAGVHFGHLSRKWNPRMAPYIFMKKNGIHIIDLNKTQAKLEEAAAAMKQMAKSGRKIMFVATKKQAKAIVAKHAERASMPYVTERWPGGMLTNFATIRKAIRKMDHIDKLLADPNSTNIAKRERLMMTRQREKLDRNLGPIKDLTRLPAAIFIVDINRENIATSEAIKLGIPTFAMVDTNTNPSTIDFPIPSNDDASSSIDVIVGALADAVIEGLKERNSAKAATKDTPAAPKAEKKEVTEEKSTPVAPKAEKKEVAEEKSTPAAPIAEKKDATEEKSTPADEAVTEK
jgi:small subunit ribosomal protein S2